MSDEIAIQLAEATAALRKPAGDSPLYASRESILRNMDSFIPCVHDTWKKLHSQAIEEILVFDYAFLEDKKRPIKGPFREFAHYMRQLWRKINDSIVWLVAGEQRHFIKRLCLYRRRGLLTECNPDSTLHQLKTLNSDPYSISVWNDATSCVDIGDITSFSIRDRTWRFTELKTGPVNEQIAHMIRQLGHDSFTDVLTDFAREYGKTGLDQAERYAKQSMIADQALELLRNEKGFDPVTSEHINIVSLSVLDEFYDDLLKKLIETASASGTVERALVDNCLHVQVDGRNSTGRIAAVRSFQDHLTSSSAYFSTYNRSRIRGCDLGGIASLNTNLMMPIAKPLYIRTLSPEQIGQIAIGRLMHRVHLFLDMDAFGASLAQEGARFYWSTPKEARRLCAKPADQRHSIVHFGRIPQYEVEGVLSTITDANLSRMLFDGIRPSVMAKQLVESSQLLARDHGSQEEVT